MAEPLRVPGASSRTLLGYLVGLGLLRVVARQADPEARACWRDGVLELHTLLDGAALETFLLERWEPAPVVSPWNGGSGFFAKDSHEGFDAIGANRSSRLAMFRMAIATARAVLDRLGVEARPEPKVAKPALLRELRATLPDAAIEWLDAAIILVGDGAAFPPLLGSGGNDGRYDIANNYAQAVAFALALAGDDRAHAEAADALTVALWRASGALRKMSLAHLTRDASPVNSPSGESDALGNPWELCLAVEGALLMAAGAGRRLADGAQPGLVAPFTLRPTGVGYGSAVASEKGRSELWLPVWSRPAALVEIESLFREARAQVGRRPAQTGLDAARASAELGVARGIGAFERFVILERAGMSNLAVPAGRVEVGDRPAVRVLGTLDPWLGRVVGYGAGDIPRSQGQAIRRLEHCAFAVAERGTPAAVRELLVALGQVESAFAAADERARPAGLQPISPLAGPWLAALDVDRVEVRLAVAFASVYDVAAPGRVRLPALRDYLHGTGLDDHGRRVYGAHAAASVPRLAPAVDRLVAAHERRHQDAARAERVDLGFGRGLRVSLGDLTRFACRTTDEAALGGLIAGVVLLDFAGEVDPLPDPLDDMVDPLLALLALAFHDPRRERSPSRGDVEICRPRLGWVSKLRAGRVRDVAGEALLRLRLAGMQPVAEIADLQTARADGPRLAAALLAAPRRADLNQVIDRATQPTATPERQEITT